MPVSMRAFCLSICSRIGVDFILSDTQFFEEYEIEICFTRSE